MKLNIFHPETKAFGLQLGDTALRAIELKSDSVVQAASETLLAKGVMREDDIISPELLARNIERLVERPGFGKFTTKNVIVNLAESKCFVRVIHIPSMKDSEIENAIPFEAESYIPIPIDQVYLDWQKVSETNGRAEILLIASAKTYIDALVSAVTQAHLIPAALEVESQSLTRLLVRPETTETNLIANIQSARTDLVMVERGNIQFTSTIPMGGNALTAALARGLGITPAQAERIKQETGVANTTEYPNLKTIILPVLQNFITEIKNVLAFHAQHSQEKVTNVLLTGGGAQLKNIDQLLSQELKSSGVVVKCGVVERIQAPRISGIPISILTFSTAFGLALRSVN